MELRELVGVPVAFVTVDEALDRAWAAHAGEVDVVRVRRPPHDHWPALLDAGFLPKPNRVTWYATTCEDEDELVARLSKSAREDVRTARRRAAAAGLRIEVRTLDVPLLDRFLALYAEQIAAMRHSLPVAIQERTDLAARADEYVAVCAFADSELVGGCLARRCPDEDLLRIRFSAVGDVWRDASLARVLYVDAVLAARRLGYRAVTLGNDPNLFGHIAKPGLFAFKYRMGFRAVPSQLVRSDDGWDEADLVVGLRALADPSFLLSYADLPSAGPPAPALRLELFTRRPDVDDRPFYAKFLAGTRRHVL
jgi:hypothetical protein